MRVTLDSNAIIDLQEQRAGSQSLRELIGLYRAGTITLCVSNIVAGERNRDGAVEPDYTKFTAKLAEVDLADAELLNPPFHWGITFWNRCIWAEAGDTLQPRIREILFPTSKDHFEPVPNESDEERAKRLGKGNNQLCDILGMWCHIRYGGGVFVTTDSNFHKATKKPRLIELGARHIMFPLEAARFLRKSWSRRI